MEESGRMKRFYLLLGVVAVIGAGWLLFSAKGRPALGLSWDGPAPAPAADGFNGYVIGSDSAPVEVVEFLDFECPACSNFAVIQFPTIREQLINTGKARWRSRDYPLAGHKYSRFAAHAAQCVGEQGHYWEMHDQLFNNHGWAQTGRDPSSLFRQLAQAAGADVGKYDECMKDGRFAGRIEASRLEGERLGASGTPTFFVNGALVRGNSVPNSDEIARLVEQAAAAAKAPGSSRR
jgi:protein-disulfide isomerase